MKEETKPLSETNAMEYEIEGTSGAHFSGLRPDGLLGPSTSSPLSEHGSCSLPAIPGDSINHPKQPFVIGNTIIL